MQSSIKSISIVENVSTPAVSLADAKVHCLVDSAFTTDDSYISGLIVSCTREIESRCGISITDKTITVIAEMYGEKELPYPPVKSVGQVLTRQGNNTDGSPNYVVPDYYTLDTNTICLPGCQGLKIVYNAGMNTIPEDLAKTLLNLVAFRYQNRGDHSIDLSPDLKCQIDGFKNYSWA